MNIVAGLESNTPESIGGLNATFAQLVKIAFPKALSNSDLTKVKRDCEILLDRIGKDPKALQELVKLAGGGDIASARKVATKLKLTEADFIREGGGCWFLIGLVILIALIVIDRKNIDWGIR